MIEDGAIAIEGSEIVWVGARPAMPPSYAEWPQNDYGDRLITPALIDAHTHVVFGGNRAVEFEMRLNGATYEEIARAGGGILSTVNGTRAATEEELLCRRAFARGRIAGRRCVLHRGQVGLRARYRNRTAYAARGAPYCAGGPIRVNTSFLGAHAVPPEYAGRDDAYIDEVCIPTLRAAHAEGLVDAVDGFCEGIAFDPGTDRTRFLLWRKSLACR